MVYSACISWSVLFHKDMRFCEEKIKLKNNLGVYRFCLYYKMNGQLCLQISLNVNVLGEEK